MAKEYIEREALLKRMEERLAALRRENGDYDHYTDGFEEGCDAVEDATAADVVEVVRCRECKHWHKETGWCYHHSHFIKSDGGFCHPWESADWKMFDADYWCADGERRDNNAAEGY